MVALSSTFWTAFLSVVHVAQVTASTEYDVVIVGAGMAGVAAAARLMEVEPSLNVVILESSNRIGGRVRSKFGFGDGEWTVEEGANYVTDYPGNPIFNLSKQYGLKFTFVDFFDIKDSTYIYDEPGDQHAKKVPKRLVGERIQAMEKAYQCLENIARTYYQPGAGNGNLDDIGTLATLSECGWTAEEALDFAVQWLKIDYEFAEHNPSTRNYPFDAYLYPTYLVNDKRGFEYLPQRFAVENNLCSDAVDPSPSCVEGIIKFGEKVTNIDYDQGGDFPGLVQTAAGGSYNAKRIIVTVPVGTLNNGDITFAPVLSYPAPQDNPFKMKQYIKIFYQFPKVFWDDKTFIQSLKENEADPAVAGQCHHWQNLDASVQQARRGASTFLEGSRVLFCTLLTEAFEQIKDENDVIADQVLRGILLDPLRRAYEDFENPQAIYYADLPNDPNAGYGAYSSWTFNPDRTFQIEEYHNFYGGGPLTDYCNWNGCSASGDWIVHISGTASCFALYEFVDGALAAGQRSANYVLRDLLNDPSFEVESLCDDYFTNSGVHGNTRHLAPYERQYLRHIMKQIVEPRD